MAYEGTSGDDTYFGTGGSDTLVGQGGNDRLNGRGGDDSLNGGAGNDRLNGGIGLDTAIYAGDVDAVTVTTDDLGIWTVTSSAGEGTDTQTGVEVLEHADGNRTLLVGEGGYDTIQSAIDAADEGDVIVVAGGTYDEDLVIDKAVTILGKQAGNAGADGARDAAGGSNETTIVGRSQITAAGAVTIDGVRFVNDSTTTGGGPSSPTLQIASGQDHTVTNSIFFSEVAGGANGVDDRAIMLPPLADGDITILNNYFTGSSQGAFSTASWGRAIWSDGGGANLTATGNTIEFSRAGLNLDMSGDSAVVITDNKFVTDGSAVSVGVDSDNLTVSNNDFQNVGTEFNFRNLTTDVTFDAETAVDVVTPANTSNDAVVVLGGSGSDNLSGTSGVDVLDGNNLSFAATDADVLNGRGGNDFLFGRAGADRLTGGAGNDALDGGAGIDTAVYVGAVSFGQNGSGARTVTDAGGTDTLTGVERVEAAGVDYLLVGAGGYSTIQEAIDAAADGDVIIVAPGTYNENLSIDKGLTVVGANGGIDGDGARGAETVINWTSGAAVSVTSTNPVVFDGLSFTGKNVIAASTADLDVTFTNSVFDLVAGGNGGNNFYFNQPDNFTFTDNAVEVTGYTGAFFQPVGTSGDSSQTTVTITGNSFTGIAGTYVAGDDNNVPVIANLSDVNGTVSGNTFTNVDIGVLVGNGAGPLDITGNTFNDLHREEGTSGGGRAAGVVFFTPEPFTDEINISGNTFDDADAGIRTSGVPGSTVEGSDIAIDDNTFTDVTDPLFQPVGGSLYATDSTIDGEDVPSLFEGGSDDDTFTSTAEDDIVDGGAGRDTVVFSGPASGYTVTSSNGGLIVTDTNAANGDQGTDTLTGVEVLDFGGAGGGRTLIVDDNGGEGTYTSIQAAIDAAAAGDTILIAPGDYTETASLMPYGDTGSLFINKAGLTLQGIDENGQPITDVSDVQATVTAGAQAGFGANFFVGPNGDGVTIRGLALKAGQQTDNKLLEVWGDNFTVEATEFETIDLGTPPFQYRAVALYIDENSGGSGSTVATYLVSGNVFNEGIVITNGVGDDTSTAVSTTGVITGNTFKDGYDQDTGAGRYDTIVVNGNVPGVGSWMTEVVQLPTITGNSIVGGSSVPMLFRYLDEDTDTRISAEQVQAVLAGLAAPSYAYVLDASGKVDTYERTVDFDGDPATQNGEAQGFYAVNSIATLNLGQDDEGDGVFGGKRIDMNAGDTIVVKSGPGGVNETIVADGLTVKAMLGSGDLNLTLGSTLVDGTPTSVKDITLADYATGTGANVDVSGNGLDNTINGNSGANRLNGGAGDDRLNGGAGNDLLLGSAGADEMDGGTGVDTVDFGSSAGVSINLSSGTHSGDAAGDTFTLVETFALSESNDVFTGLDDADTVFGRGGSDKLAGGGGSDILRGGDGNDFLDGSSSNDILEGGDGNDRIAGGTGTDRASYASAGAAVTVSLLSTGAQDTGGAGTDTLLGIEHLYGSNFGDTLIGSNGANAIIGAAGDDTIRGGNGADLLKGGLGADTFEFTVFTDSDSPDLDRITDLSAADIIDLTGIDANGTAAGNTEFSRLEGDGAFTGRGQLRLTDHGSDTWLELNTDFDAVAESIIVLSGDFTAASAEDNWLL